MNANHFKKIEHLDLFSGIGGFRFGLESAARDVGAAYRCVGFSEIDKYATASYKALHDTEGELEIGDIKTFVSRPNLRKILPSFNVLTGGFPCQPFSMMGKEGGFSDERGGLFFDILKIIDAAKPSVVLLENVKNIRRHDGGETIARIEGSLRMRYDFVKSDVFNTAEFDLPQTRNRVYILALLKKQPKSFDFSAKIVRKYFSELSSVSVSKYEHVLDILERNAGDEFLLSERIKPTILSSGTGGFVSKSEINRSPARPLTATMVKMHRACQDNYYDIEYVRTNGAVDNSQLDPKMLALKPIRKLTPHEALLLQGFPNSSFSLIRGSGVSNHQIYKQAGNAVSVNVPYAIVSYLMNAGVMHV